MFVFAENAFEGVAREPYEVGAGVEVEGNRGGGGGAAERKRECVVASGGERKGDLLLAVTVAETGSGAGCSGFEEVVSGCELGF